MVSAFNLAIGTLRIFAVEMALRGGGGRTQAEHGQAALVEEYAVSLRAVRLLRSVTRH